MNWIKCSDELPDKDIYVLGYNELWPKQYENENQTIRLCKLYNDSIPGLDENLEDTWLVEGIKYYNDLNDPTHWMHLPRVPE